MIPRLLIKTKDLEEPLIDFDRSSFNYQYQKNETRQIVFTITRTQYNFELFDLLHTGITLVFDGQQYICQQPVYKTSGKTIQKDITATHVMFECNKQVWKYETKDNGSTAVNVDPTDIMHWYFDGNDQGFDFEVKGTFGKKALTGVGDGSGQDGINLITSNWSANFWADNKHLIIASDDSFKKSVEKQFRYLYNTDDVQVSVDRTTVVNTVKCFPKQNDNGSYIFDPFIHQNADSLATWGKCFGSAVRDDEGEYTTKEALDIYAETQLHPDPNVNAQLNYQGDEDVLEGETWLFIFPLLGFDADITVVGLQKYPFDPAQKTQITFSNSQKDMMQIQRQISRSASNAQKSAGSALKLSGDTKTTVDALNQVAVRIGSDVQAQSAKLTTMAAEADTTPILPILKPDGSTFYPETDASAIKNLPASPVTSVAGKTGAIELDKSDVGMDRVDNTADVEKPVSTPQAEEIAKKQDKILISASGNKFTLQVADDGTLSAIPYTEE